MSGISKSQVSRLCQDIDQRVGRFLERPLRGQWPYLWLDATYLEKSRQDGHVVNRARVVAVGVNAEGRREVLGTACGPAETEGFWLEFLRSLAGRGLSGVRLVVSDAHEGAEVGDRQGASGDVAAVSGALHAQRPRSRVATAAPDGGRGDEDGVRAGELAGSCPVIPVSGETSKEETLWGMYRTCGDQGSGRDKRGFDTPGMHFHSQLAAYSPLAEARKTH